MTDPERHDWPKIIAELEAAGVSLHTIAKMTRKQFVQVQRWKAGSEPKHHEGEWLLRIHALSHKTLQTEVTERTSSSDIPSA